MRRSRKCLLAAGLLPILILAPAAAAQELVGTISGTVTDPNGAVVPGAKVTITNEGTGQVRTTMTTDSGFYTVPQLPYGQYSVEVSKDGFKTQLHKNVDLHSASTAVVNVRLDLGAVTETVTVQAVVETINTESGSRGELVDGTQVRELPLNGRNFIQLTQLIPGVAPRDDFGSVNKGLLAGVDMSINGGGRTGNVFSVDGANNNDVGSNRTIMVYPSIDSIAEIKIETNSYTAEHTGASGARVNIVTRSGTNEWHGSVYYFGRNDKLNANEFILNRAGQPKPKLRRNDFGYSIGGPVMKNKLFFFWSQEWNRDIEGTARSALVPTAAELTGNFAGTAGTCNGQAGVWLSSGQLAPTQSGSPVTLPGGGTSIPTFSPAGQLLVQLMPASNVAATSSNACPSPNWVASVPTPQFFREESIRGDYNISNTTTLMIRYAQNSWNITNGGGSFGLWGDAPFSIIDSKWDQPGKVAIAKLSKTFGSSMVNDFQFSWSANRITTTRSGSDVALADQIRQAFPTVFPLSSKTSGDDLGPPFFGWGVQGYPTLWAIAPWNNSQDLFSWRDDLSKVIGTHSLKFGFVFSHNHKNQIAGSGGWGSIFEAPQINGFSAGASTGNVIADILRAGTVWSITENSSNPELLGRWKDIELYASDSWKAHPRLTLNYGLRWSFLRAPYAASDNIAAFNPAAYSASLGSDSCNGLLFPTSTNPCQAVGLLGGQEGPNRGLYKNANNTIAPRLGLAWDPWGTGKTAIRAGIGQFYHRTELDPFLFNLIANPPTVTSVTFNRTFDSATCVSGCPTGTSFGSPQSGRSTESLIPNVWQWNITVEREVFPKHKVSLGYVGNHGVHLAMRQDINQVLPTNRALYAICQSNPGATGCPASLATLRPFPGVGDHSVQYFFNGGSSNYHSLQATVSGSYGRGSIYQFAYTYSKLLSIGSIDGNTDNNQAVVMDNTNFDLDRGPSFLNRPHSFVGSVVHRFPELKDSHPVVRYVVGDWEAAAILNFVAGPFLTVTTPNGSGTSNLSGLGFTGPDGQHVRPNRVTGGDCQAHTSDPLQWFDSAAFTFAGYPIGGNGDSGKGICQGPGIGNWDLAFYKNFQPMERLKIQFRLEFFNAFNHTQLRVGNNPVIGVSATQLCFNDPANTCTTGSIPVGATQVTSSTLAGNFGNLATMGNGAGVRPARQIQYGIKFIF